MRDDSVPSGLVKIIKKRWRAWLRAFHRDFGYLAIGFTVIYAVSGIAQNHLEDWGDVSYKSWESQKTIAAIPDEMPDEQAIAAVAVAANLGTPSASTRAGDEIRLEYANGSKVTAIGTQVTIQGRERRAFIGAANWLHTARNKKGWKYVADVYASLLLYLAISGIFMIKGKLGLKGRGGILITAGVAVPIFAVLLSSPQPKQAETPTTASAPTLPAPGPVAAPMPAPAPTATPTPIEAPAAADESAKPADQNAPALPPTSGVDTSGIKFLPPEGE
jgi:hypothetical protein